MRRGVGPWFRGRWPAPRATTSLVISDRKIKHWPATVNVAPAAAAFGVSKSLFYELIARGECPVRVITVGNRLKVITASRSSGA